MEGACWEPGMDTSCKVYKRRWMMLFMFSFSSTLNASHWIQYSIITNIIMEYYNVSAMYVNWSSMVYMVVYIPLIFPATWVIEKKGLRIAMIIGLSMTTAGSWLKLLSLSRNMFTVAFICQVVIGSAQIFILSVPARLASVWFEPSQVSTACAVGVFGNQLGDAIGFLVPPMVVHYSQDMSSTRTQMKYLHIGMLIPATVLLILVIFFFEAAPPLPPSMSQFSAIKDNEDEDTPYKENLKKLFRNKDYILLSICYGLNIGVYYAFSTLMNQIFLIHYPGGEAEAGRIGLTHIVGGIIGTIVLGVVLDKTHMFKTSALVIYAMATTGMFAFTYSLHSGYVLTVYLASGFLGFFMNGYITVAFEYAAELTYPVPESTSSGVLNAVGEALGVILVTVGGLTVNAYSDTPTNLLLSTVLAAGFLLSFLISGKHLHRLAANKN